MAVISIPRQGSTALIVVLSSLALFGCGPPTPVYAGLGDRVTMGIFAQEEIPRTIAEAEAGGWTARGSGCTQSFGHTYQWTNRTTPILMFNNLGVLVGMQAMVHTSTFPLYPTSNLNATWTTEVEGTDLAGLILHFADPSKMCDASPSTNRLGDRLWVRKGDSTFEEISLDLNTKSVPEGFTVGGCAPSNFAYPGSPGMGVHYWENIDGPQGKDVPYNQVGPFFLLYDKYNKLRAMGFSFVGIENRVASADGVTGELWEFAKQPLNPDFFNEDNNPKILKNVNEFNESLPDGTVTASTLHVFFSDPHNIECPGVDSMSVQEQVI